ncbi:MAG: hypothetical protein DDT33_01669 [Firmicutes bacterium]|nr:hypothetical protein [Bacillota bacterium]
MDFKKEITIKGEISVPSPLEEKIIPAKILEKENSLSGEFPSTGRALKEGRAKGFIRVYNNYSTSPQVLIVNTRFISGDGKLFRSIKRERIPGQKWEGGRLVAGFIDIEVIAAEAGPEYNIGPANFSIPGFAGSPKFFAFNGQSFQPMKGGFKKEVAQVTGEDLKKAENILIEKLKQESRESLKSEISPDFILDFILLDEAISQEIIKSSSSKKAGQEAESFVFEVKIKNKGLGFERAELEKFLQKYIEENLPSDKIYLEKSLNYDFPPKLVSLLENEMILSLEFGGKIFTAIDQNFIKKESIGKSIQNLKLFLKEQPGVNKIEIKTFPFWLQRIPADFERIKINLRFDPVRNSKNELF